MADLEDSIIKVQQSHWQEALVLVIDNQHDAIRAHLAGLDTQHITLSTGQEVPSSLMKATKFHKPFDLILLNQDVTGVDVHTLTHELKTKNVYRNPAIVLYSNNDTPAQTQDNIDYSFALSIDNTTLNEQLRALFDKQISKRNQLIKNVAAFTPKILLVEDDEINLKIVKMMLGNLHCDIQTATTGTAALDKLFAEPYDIVLMDIGLPDLNGYEITRKVRETHNPNQHAAIIAVTAFISDRELASCFDAGMDDIITKPVNVEDLKLAIACNYPVHS